MDKTFCIFGDSIVQGAYVKTPWPDLLKQYLENKYPDNFINVYNLGVGGNTVSDLLRRFENETIARQPNCVIVAIGINDTKFVGPGEFKSALQKLIDQAKAIAANITLVGLVLGNWQGEEPFTQEKTSEFNNVIKESAFSNSCQFINLHGVLTDADFTDGLHPNDQGHRKIFEVIKVNL